MLNVVIHKRNQISIKDTTDDINIGEYKWSSIFKFILDQTNIIYFKGAEINYIDENFKKDLDYVSEKILFDYGTDHLRILFKAKISHFSVNRSHLSKVWGFYHFPCLIFMKNDLQEEELIKLMRQKSYLHEIVANFDGVYILYKDIESNVLWLISSAEMPMPDKI